MWTSGQVYSFEWAIKRLLRHRTNFCILEGFLTVLLGENHRDTQK